MYVYVCVCVRSVSFLSFVSVSAKNYFPELEKSPVTGQGVVSDRDSA
jgi:hypothetical protein